MASKLRYYDIEFKIDDELHNLNPLSIVIISSMTAVYQTFIIHFSMNTIEFLECKFWGQNKIEIKLDLVTENGEVVETYKTELIIVKVLGDISSSKEKTGPVSEDVATIICLPKKPYEYMRTYVNYIAENTNPKSPYEVAEILIDKYLKGITKEIDDKNKNDRVGEQLIVPPMIFSHALDFLDENYGLFKGPYFYTCRFFKDEDTDPTFCMWDVGEKIKSNERLYTIYVITEGQSDDQQIGDAGKTDDVYYCHDKNKFVFTSGMRVSDYSYDNKFFYKPSDKLYTTEDIKGSDVQKKISSKDDPDINETIKTAQSYHQHVPGVNYQKGEAMAKLTREYQSQVTTSFNLYRNVRLKNVMKVGQPIWVEPTSEHLKIFKGNYMVRSSVIRLTRTSSAHFDAFAKIDVYRNAAEEEGSSTSGSSSGSGGGGSMWA